VIVAICIPGAIALSGCKTTQQSNDRLALRAKRTLEGRKPVHVSRPNADIKVEEATLVRGPKGGAVVVVLRNEGAKIASDLPIEVGVRDGGGETVLNAGKTLPYFQSHAPALAPGGKTTWVFRSEKPLPAGGAAFAKVGVAGPQPLTEPSRLPDVSVSAASPVTNSTLSVTIRNNTDVPQYDLEVYATAKKGRSYVAAGQTAVEHIGSDSSATVELPLIGEPKGARIELFTSPTYFQ
jgi:hypothetical protein